MRLKLLAVLYIITDIKCDTNHHTVTWAEVTSQIHDNQFNRHLRPLEMKIGGSSIDFSGCNTETSCWSSERTPLIHTHTHTHTHVNTSAASCNSWSLLLITGLELSSQVLPETQRQQHFRLFTSSTFSHDLLLYLVPELEYTSFKLKKLNPMVHVQKPQRCWQVSAITAVGDLYFLQRLRSFNVWGETPENVHRILRTISRAFFYPLAQCTTYII